MTVDRRTGYVNQLPCAHEFSTVMHSGNHPGGSVSEITAMKPSAVTLVFESGATLVLSMPEGLSLAVDHLVSIEVGADGEILAS